MKIKVFLVLTLAICLVFALSGLSMAYPTQPVTAHDHGTIELCVPARAIVDFDECDNHPAYVDFDRIGKNDIRADVHNGRFEFNVWSNIPLTGYLCAGDLVLEHHPDVTLPTQYAPIVGGHTGSFVPSGSSLFLSSPSGVGWKDRSFAFKPMIYHPNDAPPKSGKYSATVTYTVYAQY